MNKARENKGSIGRAGSLAKAIDRTSVVRVLVHHQDDSGWPKTPPYTATITKTEARSFVQAVKQNGGRVAHRWQDHILLLMTQEKAAWQQPVKSSGPMRHGK